MKYALTFLFALALLIPACAHDPTDQSIDDSESLQITVMTFHRDMRWSRWEAAARVVAPEKRQAFLGRYEELGDDFHIVEFELKSVARPSGDRALVDIEQQSYKEPVMTVKKQRFIEVWEKRGDGWLMAERLEKDEWEERQKAEKAQRAEKEESEKAEKEESEKAE